MLSQIISFLPSYITATFLASLLSSIAVVLSSVIVYLNLLEQSHIARVPRGFKKIGRNGRSNLQDEDDPKFSKGVESGADASGNPTWNLKALYIFPIKSCGPTELDEADICPTGLVWDREFSFAELVTPETGPGATEEDKKPVWRFRSQRSPGYENLALVKPELWFPNDKHAKTPDVVTGGQMLVRYPRIYKGRFESIMKLLQNWSLLPKERSFLLPLDPPKQGEFDSKDVIVWTDQPKWFDYSRYLPADLAQFVGTKNPFSLMRADPVRYRKVMRCAPREAELGYQSVVGFHDAYPLHLLNLASVRDIAARVRHEIPFFTSRRFRANFILTGPEVYDEDSWKRIRIGEEDYYCACHTMRCKLPNVDPDTAVRHRFEPDRTLKSFRKIDAGDPTNACIGLQLVPARQQGKIKVGDQVVVLERGEHLYIKQ